MKKLASLALSTCAGIVAAGADLSVGVAYTYDSPYKLEGDTTCDALKLSAGAVLDLNGYNLTVTAGSDSNAALVTNSVDAATSRIFFTPASNNGWGEQFQKLVFGGNLELTVCGIVNSGNSWAEKGFQNAVNTHTGGTVLDGYGANSSEDGLHLPRFNNTTFCGSGPLTLKNGATLLFTGSDNTTFGFSKIVFAGGTDERPNWLKSDRNVYITCPIECANASDVLHLTVDPGKNIFIQGDLSGVNGVIRTKPKSGGNIQFQQATIEEMPVNGTLRLYLHDANTGASVRYSGTATEFLLGALETDPSITEPTSYAHIQKTFEGNNVTLKVGSANTDNMFYGKIQRDSGTKDWNVEKVGTGTWTIAGGDHNYTGPTTVTGGMLAFAGAGRLTSGSLVFNGGKVGFADVSTAATTIPLSATNGNSIDVWAAAGADGTLSGAVAEGADIVKTGDGVVRLSSLTVQKGDTEQDVVTSTGGAVSFDEGTLAVGTLALDSGETLDLNGRNLMIGALTQTTAENGGSIVKNDSATLATLTANGALPNKTLALQGNIRYVVTGSDQTYFRDMSNKNLSDVLVANTHTGGTVISNTTKQLRFYDPGNFGSGPVVLCNASLMRPSSNLGDTTFKNPWEFYGENSMEIQHYAGNGSSVSFYGPWSGDGFIHIHNGFVPAIELNGDMTNFTGTLEIAYKDGTGGFWMRGDNTNGMPRATLKLANVSNATGDARQTHLKIKPGNNATVKNATGGDISYTAFPIGNLVTDGDDPADYANSYIMNCVQWAESTWEIGELGQDGTFAGWFTQETANAHLTIKKVGAGTWTWTSSLHDFDRALIVAEGRMNIDSENLSNCPVVVKSGATLGGTGTLSGAAAVTVEEGGYLAGSLTFNAGVTFNSGALFDGDDTTSITGNVDLSNTVVTVADAEAIESGRVFLSVTGSVAGRPQVSANLKSVTARNGKSGRWVVHSETSNGVTSFSLVWSPAGLSISIW